MHPAAQKKRKLSTSLTHEREEARNDATDKDRKQQKREKERILLARASVIKEKYRRLVVAYDVPWKEPPHSATHWDHLLSEAAWMWNDMAQERLWKEAVAKQLAYEALEYWKDRQAAHSSQSSAEVVCYSKDEVFGVPIGRQFRAGLQEMVKRNHRKKTSKYEKTLRKFQREYEVEELAAVYGFEPDEGFSLLNMKIPTLPCIAAPNETEKEYYMTSPAKSVPGRRPPRAKQRTVAAQQMLEAEEMEGNGSMISCRPARTPREKRQKSGRHTEIQATPSRPSSQRAGRRREWQEIHAIPGSDISISQSEHEAPPDPTTIENFLARNDDKILFFASNEFQGNWHIVSDFMSSAGFHKCPEACCERLKSIEKIIHQAQAQLIRPRDQGQGGARSMDDVLRLSLRARAKECVKTGMPQMLAARFTQHTANAHKKRCLKIKKAMQEGNIGAPSYHISQQKVSEDVIKMMGGRLATPKESWAEAHKQKVAGYLAVKFRQRQIDAAEVAVRQRMWNVASSVSQPIPSGANSLEVQQKYQAVQQQQGTMQLAASLAESNTWGTPTGIPPGFMSGAGGSLGGNPAVGHIQTPWIPPSADMIKNLSQLPNMMGGATAQGQSAMDGSAMMTPMRPGFRNVVPPIGGMQRYSGEAPMHGRPARTAHLAHHQMPVPGFYPQRSGHSYLEQVLRRCHNNPTMLRQFLHSDKCNPSMRQLIVKSLHDPNRMTSAMNAQMSAHPSQAQQRMGPPAAAPQVQSPGGRMPTASSGGEMHPTGHPTMGLSHSSFPAPPMLDHPSQFNTRASGGRDFAEGSPHVIRPRSRPQRAGFPPSYDFSTQMDPSAMDIQQSGNPMFGAMSLRMHGVNPDLMTAPPPMDLRSMPFNAVDPRYEGPVQMMDPSQGLPPTGAEVSAPDGTFGAAEQRGMSNRPMPHYTRMPPRPYGK